MSYCDFKGDLLELDNDIINSQATTPASTIGNQNVKDFSDWRNIQLSTTPSLFDKLFMPVTTNSWSASNMFTNPSLHDQQSLYTNPQTILTNSNDWSMATNTAQSIFNLNTPPQSLNPLDTLDDIIDLTVHNTESQMTTTNGFIPIQPTPDVFVTPAADEYQNPMIHQPLTTNSTLNNETELIIIPDNDIEEILEQIEAVIPDIDIDVARRTITAMNHIPSTNELVTNFLDNGYTKKSKRSSDTSLKRSWLETIDDIPKFLINYTDPVTYFFDTQRKQSELYQNHAKAFILRAFPNIDKSILEEALQEENYHFLATVRKLEKRFNIRTNTFLQRASIRNTLDMIDGYNSNQARRRSTAWIIKNNKFPFAIPHTPCEEFYDELRFAKNEAKIRRYLGKVSKDHERRVKKAKKVNGTVECNICCSEDLLIDDMAECTNGHFYCRTCVRTHVDLCFKDGKCRFPCVEGSCPGEYESRLVNELLPPKDVNRLNKRIQEENIRQAEIDGLECCPYCPYAVIVDNPDDKVFRCLNPECMKETCRLCKEPNHIPLRCHEVEKGIELEMRKFIEEHVTEAMIRRCPRCNQKFYKVEGCNKMTCSSCGLYICYVCRQTINGYDHFSNNERCTLSNQSEKLHYEEMVEAYKNAKDEYLRLHPEASDMILRYDPISHLKNLPVTSTSAT